MPKYMHQFSYSTESVKSLVANPENRRGAAARIFEAAGGSIQDMYYCYGEYDGVVISEFPSQIDATAVALAIGASGAFSKIHTTVLIEMDDAVESMKKAGAITGSYTPPSS